MLTPLRQHWGKAWPAQGAADRRRSAGDGEPPFPRRSFLQHEDLPRKTYPERFGPPTSTAVSRPPSAALAKGSLQGFKLAAEATAPITPADGSRLSVSRPTRGP
jgi:hypothetical protein